MPDSAARSTLQDIFQSALMAVKGESLITARSRLEVDSWVYHHGDDQLRWSLPPGGRVLAVGAGKATASLARGLETVLGGRLEGGVIVVKHGHSEPLSRIRALEGGHPVPDLCGQSATLALLASLEGLGRDDRVFVLLTGGASALLTAPRPGITLEDKAAVTDLLLRSGAAIEEMNTVRKRLSRVKGGGLLREIGPAQSFTLLLSDVPSGDPGMIGSGPTIPDDAAPGSALEVLRRYGLEMSVPDAVRRCLSAPVAPVPVTPPTRVVMLADSRTALDAAAARARALGLDVRIFDESMDGETHATAAAFVAALTAACARRRAGGPPTALLAAGETTLKVAGRGRGGRNQEFALVAARLLDGETGAALLAAGTDGTDGPTDAAGAFADGSSALRAKTIGVDLSAALADNDSYPVLEALDDLLITGPTGTNVMDLVMGLAL
jgi:glycerate 2-kinase